MTQRGRATVPQGFVQHATVRGAKARQSTSRSDFPRALSQHLITGGGASKVAICVRHDGKRVFGRNATRICVQISGYS